MSCNGCRVLRKGCSDSCILRSCLNGIDSAEAQANATVFVAKFFGRAGLMSFISAVPEKRRPALFQSLLFEACGRTVNPVNGAVGLLWTGNWHVCQEAVETVLRGGTIRPVTNMPVPDYDDASEACTDEAPVPNGRGKATKRKGFEAGFDDVAKLQPCDLDLSLGTGSLAKRMVTPASTMRRPSTPSMESEGSVTTSLKSGGDQMVDVGDRKIWSLFV